jgi:glyoxylase I family protein
MDIEVTGVDHLYVSVRDLGVSEAFYDRVMRLLGFRKGVRAIAGEPHVHYFNRVMQYTLRPARAGQVADPYSVGSLHHLCFQVPDRAAVDAVQRGLTALEIEASAPSLYPEYSPDYYACFFNDPDGVRLEVVSDRAGRKLVRERFQELEEFENPVQALLERDAQSPADPGLANIFATEVPSTGESFDALTTFRNTTIERIVSSAEPGTDPYVQTQDEWVMLLRGVAQLEVAGRVHTLRAGDHLALPAHTPHRVLSTSAGATWLAVHVR